MNIVLEPIRAFPESSLTRMKGSPNVGNNNLYEFSFKSGGSIMASYIDKDEYSQITITTPDELTPLIEECELGSNFIAITDSENAPLRCFRTDNNKFMIQGYQEVPANTPLNVMFYLENQVPAKNDISVPNVTIEAIVDEKPHLIAEVQN